MPLVTRLVASVSGTGLPVPGRASLSVWCSVMQMGSDQWKERSGRRLRHESGRTVDARRRDSCHRQAAPAGGSTRAVQAGKDP